MKSAMMKMLCRCLALAMFSLSFQTAHAGIIATDQAAAVTHAQTDRMRVLATLNRDDVRKQLQAQGVDPADAMSRVAAMSDAEVGTLAGAVGVAPVGADATFLAVIVAGVLVWYVFYRK